MSTWKKSALAALCAVALGGFAGCDAPGDYGRDDDDELREYPEKPGPLTGDEATGAGDVYDQPAGVGTPGQPPVQQPMQPEPWDQPMQQGIEQPGYQQPGIEPGMQQPGMQQPGIEQQGLEPVDPNLGAGSTGTIEGGEMGIERPEGSTELERPEGSTEIEGESGGVRAPGEDDVPSPGTTTPGTTAPGGTGSTGF